MMKLIDKSKTKQFGVLLIIIGTFVPSILYPFTSLTHTAFLMEILFASRGVSSNTRLQDLEVVLVKGDSRLQGNQARENPYLKIRDDHCKSRFAIPYKYIVVFGILLAFIGIGIVAFYKNKRESD